MEKLRPQQISSTAWPFDHHVASAALLNLAPLLRHSLPDTTSFKIISGLAVPYACAIEGKVMKRAANNRLDRIGMFIRNFLSGLH
jgi:hypothetical protein